MQHPGLLGPRNLTMTHPTTVTDRPSPAIARMYGRVLASWASDALRLRRAGLDRPTSRARGAWGAVGIGNRSSGWDRIERMAG